MVVDDRFIYVFSGDVRSCTFEVLDIEMENTWTRCKKIAISMDVELTSSNLFVLSKSECMLVLGGTGNESVEADQDAGSSNPDEDVDPEAEADEANEEETQEHDDYHRILVLDQSGTIQLIQVHEEIVRENSPAVLDSNIHCERIDQMFDIDIGKKKSNSNKR